MKSQFFVRMIKGLLLSLLLVSVPIMTSAPTASAAVKVTSPGLSTVKTTTGKTAELIDVGIKYAGKTITLTQTTKVNGKIVKRVIQVIVGKDGKEQQQDVPAGSDQIEQKAGAQQDAVLHPAWRQKIGAKNQRKIDEEK